MENKYPCRPSRRQQLKQPYPLEVSKLLTKEGRYQFYNFPEYQREAVWLLRFKQELIETALDGRSIAPLIGYTRKGKDGIERFYIIDGLQRLTTIVDFLDDKFRTWTPRQKFKAHPNALDPIAPGCAFSTLPPDAKHNFLNYFIYILVEDELDDFEAREKFIAVQNHMALSSAELIRTYSSQAKEIAEKIQQHPFWYQFWDGKQTRRNETFRGSLQLLGTELVGGRPSDLNSTSFFHNLASGKRDLNIPAGIENKILSRLDTASLLFAGSRFTVRSSCIGIYQAVIILQDAEVTIKPLKDRAKLTPWFMKITDTSDSDSGLHGFKYMDQKWVQTEFWDKNRSKILDVFGLKEAVVRKAEY